MSCPEFRAGSAPVVEQLGGLLSLARDDDIPELVLLLLRAIARDLRVK